MLRRVFIACSVLSGMVFTITIAKGALERWTESIPSTAPWSSAAPYSQLDPRNYNPEKEPDIDMFISSWKESRPVPRYGGLIERDILTKCEGDPLKPTRKGAVLTDIQHFSHAGLQPLTSTRPVTLEGEQEIIYIDSGKGIIKAGTKTAELHKGVAILIPPGIEFILTNTGDETLTMYIVVEPIPEGFKPNNEILVRDEKDLHLISTPGHWAHNAKPIFTQDDGLAILVGISFIWLDPMTISQPHSHEEGVEEVWFALEGDINILLGKQLRKLPPGSAFKIPPNGITPHSTINVTDKAVKLVWMMKLAD